MGNTDDIWRDKGNCSGAVARIEMILEPANNGCVGSSHRVLRLNQMKSGN